MHYLKKLKTILQHNIIYYVVLLIALVFYFVSNSLEYVTVYDEFNNEQFIITNITIYDYGLKLNLKGKEKVLEKCKTDIVTNNSCVEASNNSDKNKDNNKTTNKTSSKTNISKANKTETSNENKLVSINTATKEELLTLPGIGESKADAIIEYRTTKKFETIEEIKEVSGIGDALFEKIKDHITT